MILEPGKPIKTSRASERFRSDVPVAVTNPAFERKLAKEKAEYEYQLAVDKAKAEAKNKIDAMNAIPKFPMSTQELANQMEDYYNRKTKIPSVEYDEGVVKTIEHRKNVAKKETNVQNAKMKYEASKDYFDFGDDINLVQETLNYIGQTNARSTRLYKKDYEKAASEYIATKFNNKESAESELEELEEKYKSIKNNKEKKEIKKEIDIIRTGIYGEYSIAEHLWANANAGAARFNKNLSSTADLLFGSIFKAFGWEENFVTKWNDFHQKQLEAEIEHAENTAKSIGDKSNISGQITQGVTAALPDAILAIATAGTSTAPTAIGTAHKATSTLQILKNTIVTNAKNPNYWMSFVGQLGSEYEEALANGATEMQALAYSTLVSTLNSQIEVGGGFQKLPDDLQKAYKKGTLWDWFVSGIEEGGEETVQRLVSGVFEKIVYNPEKEFFSFTNEDAIINPKAMLKEAGLGSAVGWILGGGQLSVNTILNAKTESDYKRIGAAVLNDKNIDIEGILDYSKKSFDEGIRQLALDTNINKVSKRTAGILYNYAIRDIHNEIYSPSDIETATENFLHISENTDSKIIKAIASSQFVLRLVESGIDDDTAKTYTMDKIEEYSQNSQLQSEDNSGIINSNQNDLGGVNNDGQRYNDNSSERIRGQIPTSEVSTGSIQEATGRVYGTGQENQRRFEGQSALRNQGNNRGIEPTPKQSESLKTTAIKDKNGNPKVVHHFTDNMDFETFSKGDIGFHFGNEQQAIARGNKFEQAGRIIKAYLDIKNPIYVSTDIMCWWPSQTALKLCTDNIISNEEYVLVRDLQIKSGGAYDSPAAVKLREILDAKGYDGIIYENMYEADGESYIAFYPEQVIVIDDGKSNTTADPNGPANFMPETDNSESGDVGFSSPSDQEIYRESTDKEKYDAMFGKRKDAKQRHILDVAKKLDSGLKVVFVDPDNKMLSGRAGVFMPDSKTIYLSNDNSVVGMYCQLFKHEFVHRLELKKAYQSFKNYLFRNSSVFERYVRARLKKINGTEFDGTREEALKALSSYYLNLVRNGDFPAQYKRSFTVEYAEREMVADFVGEVLFKGKKNYDDIAQNLADSELGEVLKLEDTFAEFENLNETERGWFRRMIDTIKDFISSLKGIKQNKRLVEDLEYIEKRLARVLDSKDTKKAAKQNGGTVNYSIVYDSKNRKVVMLDRNIFDSIQDLEERAEKLEDWIINKFGGQKFNTSDYFFLIVNERTAGKMKFWSENMDEMLYKRKLSAAEHIDELIKISKFDRYSKNVKDKHKEFAKMGWNYFKSYFTDGIRTYEADISVAKTKEQSVVYNIGYIKDVGKFLQKNKSPDSFTGSPNELVTILGNEASNWDSNNKIPHKEDSVKNNISEEDENYSDVSDIKQQFSLTTPAQQMGNNIDKYSEEQYNNFGWVRYNNVLSAAEYTTLLSRYADYKHNKDKYPTTRFGEAVIHSSECMDVIMYVKGEIGNPEIKKIIKLEHSLKPEMKNEIKEEILHNERRHLSFPYETIIGFYGEKVFSILKARDYASFREYRAEQEGRNSEESNSFSGKQQDRTRGAKQNKENDRAGLKPAFSIATPAQQQRENLDKYERGEITREEYLEETDRLWGEANETYGVIPEGEKANAPIATPQAVAEDKPTRRFARTIIETGELTDEMLVGMEEEVLLGDFSYTEVSDETAIKKADRALENGTAEAVWSETVESSKTINKNQIAIGERLLQQAIKNGGTKRVLELSAELSDIFTRSGQVVQAARLLKKMTGVGRLVSAQRTVNTINKDLREKYGVDRAPIKISEGAAKRLVNAKTENGIEYAYQELLQEVANQMPVTFLEKWNAWRYFAMLCNPKTHIRNLIGNAIFVPAVRIRYFLAASMEMAKVKDKSQRTKSVMIKKEYKDFAKRDSARDEVKQLLKGNKYNDKSAIKEKQKIFKSEALNFLTEFNSNALEAEDMLFKNKHYIHALAGFLQARGVDLNSVSEEVLAEARIYAVQEAKKATFNDESAMADAIQRFANKNIAANLAVEGVLPFKRTPINIVKRGVEYSPIGLMKTLIKGSYDVKKGKITATEYIDGLASGLTGTGIMIIGMIFANLGWISGGEEDDEKSQFEKLLGKQEYAVEFFGKSYTIDWAAPACIPFFIGAEIVNTINEGEPLELSQIGNVVWNSLEPITNLSMLSGIQGVIESARYADSAQTLSAIVTDALTSYAMQGVPSLSGALARTIDPKQRSWYIDKNDKWLDSTAQTIKNNIQSKVPGLSYTQIPKIDMWGREVSRGGTAERVLENFVSPGYYSKMEYNDTSEELKRIFNKTDIDVFPNLAAKSIDINGETKHLTADEYVTYAKSKGENSFDYINEFMNASAYKKLTDEEKAEVIEGLYEYANAKAKTTVSEYDLMKRYKTVTMWERNGKSAVDYYIYKAISK